MAELIVGTNSYMTLEEANELVSSSYLSSSKEREYWNSLSDDDKTILIINATDKVDIQQMCYIGIKRDSKQNMEWPRVIHGKETECPWSIKKGLILQLLTDKMEEQTSEFKLKEMGVKSFADGGGGKIEFANSSDSVSNMSRNKLSISKNIWSSYFKEWSHII